MSKPYRPQDFYFKKAKKQHYVARSVFKLQEIHERYKLFKKGLKILDLGCAPGAWSQYCIENIGPKGTLLGIDLKKMTLRFPQATFIQADIFKIHWKELFQKVSVFPPFDVIVSDMAPQTTGISNVDQTRSQALTEEVFRIGAKFLKKGGHLVCKVFENPDLPLLKKTYQRCFQKLWFFRPKSTRSQSKEIFLIGKHFIDKLEGPSDFESTDPEDRWDTRR